MKKDFIRFSFEYDSITLYYDQYCDNFFQSTRRILISIFFASNCLGIETLDSSKVRIENISKYQKKSSSVKLKLKHSSIFFSTIRNDE